MLGTRSRRGLSQNFLQDRSASFAIITGVTVAALAMAVGLGINLTQAFHVKSSLRSALDAAVTSTARDLTTGKLAVKDARPLIEAFLQANSNNSFTDADAFVLDTVTVDETTKSVVATAHANVELAFPLFTTQKPTVAITSAAVYSDRSIEVAMVLDITGSMAGSKIQSLKTAATNAVNTFLVGQNPANPRVRVAIVPYSDSVNTGALSNVVYAEKAFTTGEPPRLNDPRFVSVAPDTCATERKGSQQFTDAGPTIAMVNRDYRLATCPAAALMPLSSDIASLSSTIGAFKAGGSTAGHIGIQWGWYMLSPKWSSVLTKSAQPSAYKTSKVSKYAIVMTDGEFNTAYADVAKGAQTSNQPVLSRQKAETLCDAMKKQDIEIFTVGFMLKEAAAKAVLKDCSSNDSGSVRHYFEASTGADLDAAFQSIARNIERLALTE
jgi:Flp pilus assembly protein TadG